MVRRVHMRPRVSDHADFFDRPAFPVRPNEIIRRHAKELLHLSAAFGLMLNVVDGARQRLADGVVFQRDAQIDQSRIRKHTLASFGRDGDRSICQ